MKRSYLIVAFVLISLFGLVACETQLDAVQQDETNTTTETVSEASTTDDTETTTEVVTDEATSTESNTDTGQADVPEEAVEAMQVSNLQFINAYADW